MRKTTIILLLHLFCFTAVNAQNGGLIYYLKNSGKLVSKDSADYSMVVLPPDSSVDKNLYVVYEYYPNGKVRLVTNSNTNDINLLYQGNFIAYFANGRKKQTGAFINGRRTGHEVDYYPNGRVYITKNYLPNEDIYLNECRDSLGNVLAENGKGKWIKYNADFTSVIAAGNVDNGKEQGEWEGDLNKYETVKSIYNKGKLVKTASFYKSVGDRIYAEVEKAPSFPGGGQALGRFLADNIRYPVSARENGIQGTVEISFVIEKDGTLTGAKVSNGVAKIIDDEALRVMRLCPPWSPGTINGAAVRSTYNAPITFSLSN
ncbi:MAG: TonB family protein [Mucilaginibacter sp.]